MDSWMPCLITRNFIRAFTPTLVLVIAWDLCRNLFYMGPARMWAVAADVIALSIVIAIRLVPPLSAAREQIRFFFHKSHFGFACIYIALFSANSFANPTSMLLLSAGYALCNDLSWVCKISREDAELAIHRFYWGIFIVVFFVYCLASSIAQLAKGTFVLKNLLSEALAGAVLILILAFIKWWGNGREPIPHIQELGLNENGARKSA